VFAILVRAVSWVEDATATINLICDARDNLMSQVLLWSPSLFVSRSACFSTPKLQNNFILSLWQLVQQVQ